jgi:hypothetical protein
MTQEDKMTKPANYFAIAQFLQSACATRCIEFKNGGFFCAGEEVTGKKFIVDLQKLSLGSVTREENGTVSVRNGRLLWDCFPDDRRSRNENGATVGSVFDNGGSSPEQIIAMLEDYESGALVNFVADSPDGKAAFGRLCNVYGRHLGSSYGSSNPIVKLTTCRRGDAKGHPIRAPEFSVVGWEGSYRSSMDDDIPF